MRDDVDVSVLMLTYNHERYIRYAIESVLAQETELRYELLIGDDASTDSTSAIVREYAEKYPEIVKPVLRANDVEFVSVTENFDTSTPMGRAMLHIVMVFAQLERETTAERVKDNYGTRAAAEAWPGGPALYGYRNGRIHTEDGRQVPTVVPSEELLPVVLRIFREYAEEDTSLGDIVRGLNADGIPCVKLTRRMVCSGRYNSAHCDVRIHMNLTESDVRTGRPFLHLAVAVLRMEGVSELRPGGDQQRMSAPRRG